MDFTSKIMEAVEAAEKEISQLMSNYETTIKRQKEEITVLSQYKRQTEQLEEQKIIIQELREKLKSSEKEKSLLQGQLYLKKAKGKKEDPPPSASKADEGKSQTDNATGSKNKPSKKEDWEKTLIQVQKDLKEAAEKKKREKSYYESDHDAIPDAMADLAALNSSSKPSIYRYKVNVVDQLMLEKLVRKYSLVEREAILPLYETKNSREAYLYTEVETIFIDLLNKEIYMIDEEFEKLMIRYSPLMPKYRRISSSKTSEPTIQNLNGFHKERDSQVIKQPASSNPSKDTLFSEQSDLNKMGYRISGSTRRERWEVLQRAVPVLGLKKVVSIISANIKIRKKQSNGELKYQHAIAEWEYDLIQLKDRFYRGEFKWPMV